MASEADDVDARRPAQPALIDIYGVNPSRRGHELTQGVVSSRRPSRFTPFLNQKISVSTRPERIVFRDLSLPWRIYLPTSFALTAAVVGATPLVFQDTFGDVGGLIWSAAIPMLLVFLLLFAPGGLRLEIDSELISYRFGRSDLVTRPITEISHCELVSYPGGSEGGSQIARVCFVDGTSFAHDDTHHLVRSIHWFRPDLVIRWGKPGKRRVGPGR